MLKIIATCCVILSYFHGHTTQATPPSCPDRPASDIRGLQEFQGGKVNLDMVSIADS